MDGALLKVLVSNHAEFRKFLSKRLPNETVAEEILQQSMAKAVEKIGDLKNEESVVAWFYHVLRNVLIDYYRSRASDSQKNEAYLQQLLVEGRNKVAAQDELNSAVCACMTRLLPTLKPAYSEVLQRVDLNNESLEDAAKSMAISVNNLSVRLHRARQALKKSLERSCGTCTEHGCLDCTCE